MWAALQRTLRSQGRFVEAAQELGDFQLWGSSLLVPMEAAGGSDSRTPLRAWAVGAGLRTAPSALLCPRTWPPPCLPLWVPVGWDCSHPAPHVLSPLCVHTLVTQPCLILCDPVNYSPPVSSVHGISQARILQWVAMPSSRGSSWPRDWTCVSSVSCTGRWILYQHATWEALWVPEADFIRLGHTAVGLVWVK